MAKEIQSILIVEDDFKISTDWQNQLETHGYEVQVVATSNDAIPLLLNNNYDCYILDLFHVQNRQFHGDGGIKLISKIRRKERHRRTRALVIAVTGYFRTPGDGLMSTADTITSLDGDITLKKPIEISTIINVMKDWEKGRLKESY